MQNYCSPSFVKHLVSFLKAYNDVLCDITAFFLPRYVIKARYFVNIGFPAHFACFNLVVLRSVIMSCSGRF